jgi:hypothetical protein
MDRRADFDGRAQEILERYNAKERAQAEAFKQQFARERQLIESNAKAAGIKEAQVVAQKKLDEAELQKNEAVSRVEALLVRIGSAHCGIRQRACEWARNEETARRLMTIPGIGLNATARWSRQSVEPTALRVDGTWRPGWAWCPGKSQPAASRVWSESISGATSIFVSF